MPSERRQELRRDGIADQHRADVLTVGFQHPALPSEITPWRPGRAGLARTRHLGIVELSRPHDRAQTRCGLAAQFPLGLTLGATCLRGVEADQPVIGFAPSIRIGSPSITLIRLASIGSAAATTGTGTVTSKGKILCHSSPRHCCRPCRPCGCHAFGRSPVHTASQVGCRTNRMNRLERTEAAEGAQLPHGTVHIL